MVLFPCGRLICVFLIVLIYLIVNFGHTRYMSVEPLQQELLSLMYPSIFV